MIEIQTGSKGNCCFLYEHPYLILFDLGLPYTKIKQFLLEHCNLYLEKDEEIEILVLITHLHQDHFKKTTLNKLVEKIGDGRVEWLHPSDLEGTFFWNRYTVTYEKFTHGDTYSTMYRVETGKQSIVYATDIDAANYWLLLTSELLKDVDTLFLEGNYDEEYTTVDRQASLAVGYDVNKGFNRHMSKQQAMKIIDIVKPKRYKMIHRSSRYFDVTKHLERSVEYLENNINHG